MASQRITRDTFDAVVQEKMKRYRISMEQAIANTIREFQLEAGSSKMDSYDSLSRDQERLSYRDLPRDNLNRKWDVEMRRDSGSNPLYFRELGRESGGLHSDPALDRWGSVDPLLKERLYREELLARDLDLSRRSWELERNSLSGPEPGMPRSDMFREFRGSQSLELGPGKEVFREPRAGQSTRGVMHMLAAKGQGGQRFGSGGYAGKAGEASGIKQSPQKKDMPVGENEFSEQIVMWAKFNKVKNDSDLLRQHKALFKVETETCRMVVNSFKGRMSVHHTELCFSSLKPISHPTLNSPKIDNDLLDLLVATKTVTVKNDFFDAIKPFDKEMMILQQRLLKCATPLLLACNTFELKQPILTDAKQLFSALDNTMFMARKSLVLLGQTFALATALRQNNVMEVLGISGTDLKPSKYPNFKDSFLFGREFIIKLKDWVKKSGHKLTLKSRANVPKETAVDNKEETKTEAESEARTSADPNVVATIDQLLEYTKKEDKGEGEKPAFWFLFDKNSNEYKYYQQKLEQFHKSTGHLDAKTTQTTKAKKSPEELAVESVRAMLYARKALLVKRKLFGSLTLSRRSKGKQPVHRLSKPMKASRKIRKVSQKVGKNNLTQDHKKENVNQELKEDGKTPAVGKETVTPAVKMEAATLDVKEAAAVEEAASTVAVEEAASTMAVEEAASPMAVEEAASPMAVEVASPMAVEEAASTVAVKEVAASTAAVEKETAAVKKEAAATAAVKKEAAATAAVKKEAAATAAVKKEAAATAAVKKEAAATAAVKKETAAAAAVKKETAAAAAVKKETAAVKETAAAAAVKKETAAAAAVKKETAAAVKKEAAVAVASVKKAAATVAVKKAAATPAVKKAATTPAVKEAATPVGKKGNVASEVKKQTSVKPAQDASTKQSSKKVDIKKQEVPCKSSTGATSKLLKEDQSSDEKAETSKEPEVSDVDEKTKDTAIKLAQFVVQMGPEIEEFSMQNSVNNPDFWFLREKDSPAYKYYKSKLAEFKEEQQEATSDVDDELEGVRTGDEGEASGADGASVAAFSQMPTPSRPPILRKRVAKLKVGMLPAKRVCLVDEPQVHDPVRIDYERPKGRGYNRRKKPADLEFANKKITQQNVGFQMLSKMGWQEGQGLGSSGSGIKNPIKVGAVSAGEGLGGESKEPPQSNDDNFDAFRQRMMNMYKQKISK